MAYQFKEPKINVALINIYIPQGLLKALEEIACFENLSRSKCVDLQIKGGDYEHYSKLRKKIHKKALSKQKNARKGAKNLQKKAYINQCLPYFADTKSCAGI
ncbi:hypothetical protein CQA49_08150 [Helicobacter sp. MIT 00-7814]|nr:hypothetical protein CQA37_09425 [Helicobacter sp. MIT 99-10781]RDU52577.1 hypothetical protein CQA49_08150 [Helicobacter sp. MIT 00-7814]